MANEIILGQGLDALNTNKIINLPNGTDPGDSVNFSQLSALIGGVTFIGPYNATTNAPDLVTPAVGVVLKGYMYVVTVAGTSFYGNQLEVGDILISNVDNPAVFSDWTVAQSNNTVPVYISDYFVSDDNGDDSNSGLSTFSAFKTLGAALDAIDTAGVASAIHFLDDSTYIVTEASGTPNERTTTVPIVLIGNSSTLIGQPTGVVWKVNNSRIDGMNVDGTDLTFRPTGTTTGQTDHLHNWFKIANPNTLYQTVSSDPTPNRWCINANRVKGTGPFINCDNAAASFYHVFCNDLGLDFNSANSEYIFIGNGNGCIINYVGMNTDCSNTGSGAGKVVKLDNNAAANLYFHCFGGGVANGGDINTGAVLYVNGSSVNGEPLTYSGTGEIHDHSIVDGINFANMPANTGLVTADLVNIHDISTGRQVQATLTELQTLITAGFVTIATVQTITGGKTFTANVLIQEGIGSGLAPNAFADNLTITGDTLNNGLSIMTPNGGNGNLYFGETGLANNAASIAYIGSVNELRALVNNVLKIRLSTSTVRLNGITEVRGEADAPQFRVYSHTVTQGNPLVQLYDTSGAVSWQWYNSVLRAAGRDTKIQSAALFDTIIARSTGATGTKFDDSGVMTNFYQIGVGADPNAVAILDLTSTDKGFRAPRMTAAQASAITAIDGLMLYTTTTDATFTEVGYWVYESGAWVKMTAASYPQTITRTTGTHAAANNQFILCDTSGGNITINLPAAVSNLNSHISIKKTAAANTVTIDGNASETIDGGLTAVLSSQWEMITVVCDGSNWFIGN